MICFILVPPRKASKDLDRGATIAFIERCIRGNMNGCTIKVLSTPLVSETMCEARIWGTDI